MAPTRRIVRRSPAERDLTVEEEFELLIGPAFPPGCRGGRPDEWREPTIEENSEFESEQEREQAYRAHRDEIGRDSWAAQRYGRDMTDRHEHPARKG